MSQASHSRWPAGLASVIAVLIALYALFCAFMSAWMGIGSIIEHGHPLPGVAFVLLDAIPIWYVVALFASLWFRREGLHIGLGLFFGFLILCWFVSVFGHEIYTRLITAAAWTAKTYFEALCLGPVLVASWILTVLLLFRPAFVRRPSPNRPLPRPRPKRRRTRRGWSTTGAALSAMPFVTLTRHPVSTLPPAPAVASD